MPGPTESGTGFEPPANNTPEAVKDWLTQNNRISELSAIQKAVGFVDSVHGIDVALQIIDKTPDEKAGPDQKEQAKKEIFESMRDGYEDFVDALTTPTLDMLKSFDRLHNQVPWESRYGEQTYDTVITVIDDALRRTRRIENEDDKKMEVALLKEIKRTALWAQGFYHVQEGSATSIDTYFAGEDQMRQLLTNHIKITETDFEQAFSQNLPGLDLARNDPQRKLFSEKLSNPKEIGANVESVRELLTQFSDDRMQLAIMVAEADQEQRDKPVNPDTATQPREREVMYFDQRKRQFVHEIFAERELMNDGTEGAIIYVNWRDAEGNDHLVPKNLLNYYRMEPTEENKRRYKALMQASISLNALERFRDGENVATIGEEVRNRAREIMNNIYADEKFSLREKLASIIVRGGINMDEGLMTAGELGWGWKYEIVKWEDFTNDPRWAGLSDEERDVFETMRQGDFIVLRMSEIGGIYVAGDTQSPMHHERHVWDYHALSETTSMMHVATADAFRREMVFHRPDWLPPIEKYLGYNSMMRKLLMKLFTNGYSTEEIWKGEGYGDIDPRVLDYAKKHLHAWVSWPKIDGKDGQYYALPMFTPSSWLSLNFWRSLAVTEARRGLGRFIAADSPRDGPSLWERFKEGMKLSEVQFVKYKDLSVDWTNVNKAMFARVLMPLFLPHKFSRSIQEEYEKFFPEKPSADAIRELAKRIRLGLRGEPVKMGVVEVLLIPLMYNLHLLKTKGLMGITGAEGESIRKQWKEALSSWEVEAANLPKTKTVGIGAIKNYGKSIALFMDFYGSVFYDYAKLASSMINAQNTDAGVRVEDRVIKGVRLPEASLEDVKSAIS